MPFRRCSSASPPPPPRFFAFAPGVAKNKAVNKTDKVIVVRVFILSYLTLTFARSRRYKRANLCQCGWGPAKSRRCGNIASHGYTRAPAFPRIRRGFRHHRHLVAPLTFSILPESFLRSVVAKFLPICRGLPGHHSVRPVSIRPRSEDRRSRHHFVFGSMFAQRRSPNYPSRRVVLHGARCLLDFYSFFRHLHRAPGARAFSGGTSRNPAMAISSWHASRSGRCVRCDLVSTERAGSTHRVAGPVHRVHGIFLLGTLPHSDQATVCSARFNPQLRRRQRDHVDAAASAGSR